jgi:hypothetical protein
MDQAETGQSEHESALAQERLDILRREIAIGLNDVANGRLSSLTIEEIAAEVASA